MTANPFIWLYEIELPTDPPTRLRLCRHPVAVTFGQNSSGQDLVYSPFPISHKETRQSAEGSLPTVTLTVSNVNLEMQGYVNLYDGLVGQPVRIMLIDYADGSSGTPKIDEEMEVLSSEVTREGVVARLGRYNLNRQTFPLRKYSRDYCGWLYKGAECGYVGSLGSCSKTLEGSNGCIAHGDDEEANGLPRKHPKRFGAFPGIPRPFGLGAG